MCRVLVGVGPAFICDTYVCVGMWVFIYLNYFLPLSVSALDVLCVFALMAV